MNTTNLIPLSATYPFSNITLKSDITKWKDGYTMYSHPIFNNNVDCSLNNNSIFYLTSASNLFNFVTENPLDGIFLGDYVMLKMNSQFVTNVNNELYLTPLSSDESYFRIIANSDNTFTFLQSTGLYVTVSNQNPFDLTLEEAVESDETHHQKFNIQAQGTSIYIMINIINESTLGTPAIERYWSYTKFGPEAGKLRANGTIANNDYLLEITPFDTTFIPTGLTRDHTWVRYYNDLVDTTNNRNVEIDESESITGIKVNHLLDLPYNSTINISSGTMNVNFANMKTIQTSNYEYRKK